MKTYNCIITGCNKKNLIYPNRHFLFSNKEYDYALCNKHGKIANLIRQHNPEFQTINYNNLNKIIKLIKEYK